MAGERKAIVDEAFGWVVEDLGVDEGEFGSADAVGLHLLELAEDLGLFGSGSEPPPAHHGLGVVGWVEEGLAEDSMEVWAERWVVGATARRAAAARVEILRVHCWLLCVWLCVGPLRIGWSSPVTCGDTPAA